MLSRTRGHTGTETIRTAPTALRELRGWLLAFEHQSEQRMGDTSWLSHVRGVLSYAIELADEQADQLPTSVAQ